MRIANDCSVTGTTIPGWDTKQVLPFPKVKSHEIVPCTMRMARDCSKNLDPCNNFHLLRVYGLVESRGGKGRFV